MDRLLFPHAATELAGKVDWLFLGLILISAFYLALIFGPMIYFVFKYRRGKKADRSPIHIKTWKVEVVWTVVPFLMMLGIFAWAADLYYQVERPPAGALEAFVVAKQWMWKIQHAEGNREINELHVPLGTAVKLTMTSQDVIHSFFIPAFRVKQDVVPGRYVTEWFRPARVGTYHLFCAEYCGSDHSLMGGYIHVMKPEDYAAWLTAGRRQTTWRLPGSGCSGIWVAAVVTRAVRSSARRDWKGFMASPCRSNLARWSRPTTNTSATPSCCRLRRSPPVTAMPCPRLKGACPRNKSFSSSPTSAVLPTKNHRRK